MSRPSFKEWLEDYILTDGVDFTMWYNALFPVERLQYLDEYLRIFLPGETI